MSNGAFELSRAEIDHILNVWNGCMHDRIRPSVDSITGSKNAPLDHYLAGQFKRGGHDIETYHQAISNSIDGSGLSSMTPMELIEQAEQELEHGPLHKIGMSHLAQVTVEYVQSRNSPVVASISSESEPAAVVA